jgi:murein DD-endopeptidase MepM/ murein hydrolase activator NlpD
VHFPAERRGAPAPPAPLFALVAAGAAWIAFVVVGATGEEGRTTARIAAEPMTLSAQNGALTGESPGAIDPHAADGGAGPSDAAAAVDAAPPPPPTWRVSMLAKDPSIDIDEAAIGHRTFLDALLANGLSRNESYRLIRAFNRVHHFEKCNPKDTVRIAKERAGGHLVAFEYATSPLDVWQARQNDAGELEAKKLELRAEKAKVMVAIAVGDDLRASIVQAGLHDDLLGMLDDALDGHAELADVRSGARLRIIATEERIDGQFVEYAQVDAIEYLPASAAASPMRVYYFGHAPATTLKNAKHPQPAGYYFDARGRQPYHGGWRSPVPLARIASRFNPRRMHPVLHVVTPHNGVDFAAPPGTPVYSTAAGTVKSVGDSGPCGNMVQVVHTGGLVSAYCHLSRFASGLHPGQHVEARQLVGYVGRTGRTTGPHLHFAIKRGEAFIDPLALKLDGVRVVPLADRGEFERMRAELDIALDGIALPTALPAGDAGATDSDAGTDETIFEESNE